MKYIVLLVMGLRARLATTSCAAEETAFDTCYTSLTDSTYDGNPFTYWEDDDESMSLRDCAGASATFDDRCASGPAECPAEYEAWVECGYADLAETVTGAVQQYVADVRSRDFPNENESY